jgi:hypothetical protein
MATTTTAETKTKKPKEARPKPFFHLESTKKYIEELTALDSVVIYVGAGVSIERTGLTWEGLSAQMLDDALGSYADRVDIVRNASSTLAVASAIVQQVQEKSATNWRDQLSSDIGKHLYAGPADQTAYFVDRVLALASAYIRAGRKVIIVTPNYDRFLLDGIEEQQQRLDNTYKDVTIVQLGVDGDGKPTAPDQELAKMNEALAQPDTLTVVFIHGTVERPGSSTPPEERSYPVVSEEDYARTRDNSQLVLGELFSDRHLIVVGSSVTDPPLVHALVASRPSGKQPKRYVIRPIQGQYSGSLSAAARENLQKVEERRAKHLGVELISPTYYFQAPQVLEEVRVNLGAKSTGPKYSDPNATHRYGGRLLRWWDDWLAWGGERIEDRQERHYRFLREEALPRLRDKLNAKGGERLKLEAWIRWNPEKRRLALWASSNGSWPESQTMRKDRIASTTQIIATQAFQNGAPTYEKDESELTRWKSYLAKPIRTRDREYGVFLPVGVICVASMAPQEESTLNPTIQTNRAELMVLLDIIGTSVFDPHTPLIDWDAEFQPMLG